MKRLMLLLMVGALFLGAGCYTAPVMPPTGLIVTSVSAPLDTDMKTTPKKIQVGESSSISILGLVAFGDASMEAAAMDGGLKTIEYADYDYFSILGIYHKFTVRAYGE